MNLKNNNIYALEYNNQVIEYELIKSRIKNIYIQIKDGKVVVKTPTFVRNKDVVDFINKKAKWIYTNLEKEKKKDNNVKPITKTDIEYLKNIVEESIQKFGDSIGAFPKKVRIRDIKYAWGSCSSNKNITISMKLANKKKEIIEYVVLHEMCHLKHMNHSKDFWNLVESNMSNYKTYRKELKN